MSDDYELDDIDPMSGDEEEHHSEPEQEDEQPPPQPISEEPVISVPKPQKPYDVPPLRKLCTLMLIKHRDSLGDLGHIDHEAVRQLLQHCNKDLLAYIEDETRNGSNYDLSWYTWHIWRERYAKAFGERECDVQVPALEVPCPGDYVPPAGVKVPPGDYRRMLFERQHEVEERSRAASERLRGLYNQEKREKDSRKTELTRKLPTAKRARTGALGGPSAAFTPRTLTSGSRATSSTSHNIALSAHASQQQPKLQNRLLKDLGVRALTVSHPTGSSSGGGGSRSKAPVKVIHKVIKASQPAPSRPQSQPTLPCKGGSSTSMPAGQRQGPGRGAVGLSAVVRQQQGRKTLEPLPPPVHSPASAQVSARTLAVTAAAASAKAAVGTAALAGAAAAVTAPKLFAPAAAESGPQALSAVDAELRRQSALRRQQMQQHNKAQRLPAQQQQREHDHEDQDMLLGAAVMPAGAKVQHGAGMISTSIHAQPSSHDSSGASSTCSAATAAGQHITSHPKGGSASQPMKQSNPPTSRAPPGSAAIPHSQAADRSHISSPKAVQGHSQPPAAATFLRKADKLRGDSPKAAAAPFLRGVDKPRPASPAVKASGDGARNGGNYSSAAASTKLNERSKLGVLGGGVSKPANLKVVARNLDGSL